MRLKEIVKAMPTMCSKTDVDNFISMLLQNNMRVMGVRTMNKIIDKAANATLKNYLSSQMDKNGIIVEVSHKNSGRKSGVSFVNEKNSSIAGGFNNSLYGSIAEERSIRRSAYEFNKLVYGVQSD